MPLDLGISRAEIRLLKEARRHANSDGAKSRQGVPSLLELTLEAVVSNCCFFFKTLHCTQLKHLPSTLIQRILDKIFAEDDYCVKHGDCMVMSLLGPNVTEFNHLLVWQTKIEKHEKRGFDNLAYLCLTCPNLKKLETIKCKRKFKPELRPHLINFIGDVCVMKNLTSLVLHHEFICSVKELRLIQENLIKLEHLQVEVKGLKNAEVKAFAGMLNLKRLHLGLDHGRRTSVDALVKCAGRIKNLQTLFTDDYDSYDNIFVEKYAAQFPQKPLHLLNTVTIEIPLSMHKDMPWPNFLTCDELEVIGLNCDTSEFAGISFPLKRCKLEECQVDAIYRLLDTLGQSIEELCIEDAHWDLEKLSLNEVMRRCPNLDDLTFKRCHDLTAFFDFNSSGCYPLRQEHFSNLLSLTFDEPGDDYDSPVEGIDMYKKIFCKAKELEYLDVDIVMLAKAGLKALEEDKDCLKKVQDLSVSMCCDNKVTSKMECEHVFLFVKNMIMRSKVLKEINVCSYNIDSDAENENECKIAMELLSSKIERYAKSLGIFYAHVNTRY